MNQILRLSVAVILFTVIACGKNEQKDKATLEAKKAMLAKLQKEQAKLTDDIKKLEEEIIKEDPSVAAAKTAKLVEITAVSTRKFEHFIELQGKVDADNISYVSPRGAPALVKAMYIKKGDNIKKGQLLLKLDDAIVKQQITAAKQKLEQLKTQLAYAQNLYERQKNLWEQNIGTEVQLITAKTTAESLENQLKGAEEDIKTAQEQWATTNVYAEVSGTADQVNIRVGELFTGFTGATPQIVIINTSSLKVTADIPETYLAKIRRGAPVQVTIPDLENKVINTNVSVISQAISATSRGFIVEAKIPSIGSLKPNMVVQVKIQDYAVANTVVIPLTTIQTDEKGKFVFVLSQENGKTISRKKQITIGEVYGDMVEVKTGLTTGEQLISRGYQSLYDGQTVTTEQ
ncbi:MAG TPA: efflux RND transporter periplasmic adaptor subunit [Chitinophagaceae bacterium]|nr:efflux RND transporter periplasmic adaptor subunit [Chitinophagaceae bacterium]